MLSNNLPAQNPNPEEEAIVATDLAFSYLCREKGMKEAFLAYAAEDILLYRDGPGIIYGRNALRELYNTIELPAMEFSWMPEGARVAESGELGYSWGEYTITYPGNNTTKKGKYLSVWKLTREEWKLAADCGSKIEKQ
ncbi:MAG: nuclear transport factor 2 family protein [Bacteroidales bacterium]|nr:nuclear transport factor 2 family protein [Bacteroidales bacterium]